MSGIPPCPPLQNSRVRRETARAPSASLCTRTVTEQHLAQRSQRGSCSARVGSQHAHTHRHRHGHDEHPVRSGKCGSNLHGSSFLVWTRSVLGLRNRREREPGHGRGLSYCCWRRIILLASSRHARVRCGHNCSTKERFSRPGRFFRSTLATRSVSLGMWGETARYCASFVARVSLGICKTTWL